MFKKIIFYYLFWIQVEMGNLTSVPFVSSVFKYWHHHTPRQTTQFIQPACSPQSNFRNHDTRLCNKDDFVHLSCKKVTKFNGFVCTGILLKKTPSWMWLFYVGGNLHAAIKKQTQLFPIIQHWSVTMEIMSGVRLWEVARLRRPFCWKQSIYYHSY